MDNLSQKVYAHCISKINKQLTDEQDLKFHYACKKAILENPDLGFNDWVIAAKVYLTFIIDFPDLDLGPVMPPHI